MSFIDLGNIGITVSHYVLSFLKTILLLPFSYSFTYESYAWNGPIMNESWSQQLIRSQIIA